MKKYFVLPLFALLFAFGCASNGTQSPDNSGLNDIADVGDLASDTGNTDVQNDVNDVNTDNGNRDITTDTAGEVIGPCKMVKQGRMTPPVAKPKKFAVGVFHYNVQYVAGGVKGFKSGNMFDMDAKQVEDAIVVESLDPLLDILLDHPKFAADVEMQGYMLDIIRERHPAVLKKMWKLIESGQIEVMSFHYSDQLFVAHNHWSMEKSIDLNEEAFQAACTPLAPAVFCQEGQFSEGMQVMLGQVGQTVGVLKGMYGYSVKDRVNSLLYTLRGKEVVTTDSMSDADSGIEIKWYAVDDGEVLVTNGLNPYFGKGFKMTDSARKKLINMFQGLVDNGYYMTTVGDYVQYLHEYNAKKVKLPFILDGTWHPSRSDNLFAWMGRAGMFAEAENDNGIMTGLEASALAIKAFEALVNYAKTRGTDVTKYETAIHDLARTQVLAEVSDATGWNPWKGEVDYALTRIESIKKDTAKLINELGTSLFTGPQVQIDLATGNVTDQLTDGPVFADIPADPQWTVTVDAKGFDVKQSWFKVPSMGEGVYRLDVTLTKTDPKATTMQIAFDYKADHLMYTPAMLDDQLETIELDKIATDPFTLGLANGLIGLDASTDDSHTFLVEDTRSVHLAAHVDNTGRKMWFRDETINGPGPVEYHFYFLNSADSEAVKFAKRLNITPVMTFPLSK